MIGDYILEVTGGNIILLLLGVFLIFYIDSMVLTLLPEVLILFFFGIYPEGMPVYVWAALLIIMANLGDVSGNYTVYFAFKRWKWFHKRAANKLKKYVGFLVLKDEKLILLNRVAPFLPMCGVFMAACKWNVKKSLFYIYIGGVIKYSIILALYASFRWVYPADTAFWITLILVGIFLGISFIWGRYEKKRFAAKRKGIGEKGCLTNDEN